MKCILYTRAYIHIYTHTYIYEHHIYREWDDEDAAQHAYNLAQWRVKILQVGVYTHTFIHAHEHMPAILHNGGSSSGTHIHTMHTYMDT
jgi:hypothetical protein